MILVAPLAGARIEIIDNPDFEDTAYVAPLAGARIEINPTGSIIAEVEVAPLAGARIEMFYSARWWWLCRSLPSRERGLKFLNR